MAGIKRFLMLYALAKREVIGQVIYGMPMNKARTINVNINAIIVTDPYNKPQPISLSVCDSFSVFLMKNPMIKLPIQIARIV